MAVDTVVKNGLVKDFNPPSGIAAVTEIIFDPTAQRYSAGMDVWCPQGDSAGILTATPGTPTDTQWDGRYPPDATGGLANTGLPGVAHINTNDDGFGTTVKSASGKYFTANVVGRATSGSSEPTVASVNAGTVDGEVSWSKNTLKNGTSGWQASTTYATTDWIIQAGESGVLYVWKCISAGVSGSSLPTGGSGFDSSVQGSVTVTDGADVLWSRRGVYKGAWAATTVYGSDVSANHANIGSQGYRHCVTIASDATAILLWTSTSRKALQVASSEPAWDSQTARSYWYDGAIVWITSSSLFGGLSTSGGTEKLVVTGIVAPAGAKTLRITNGGGTNMMVVLANHNSITDYPGVHGTWARNATDADSSSGNRFDFGARSANAPGDLYLDSGESADLSYNTGTGAWNIAVSTVGKSLAVPYTMVAAVGKSCAQPWTDKKAVGKSNVTPYTVRAAPGKSLAQVYTVGPAVGKSLAQPYKLTAHLAKSCVLPYAITGVHIGKSLVLPYSFVSHVGKSSAFTYLLYSLGGVEQEAINTKRVAHVPGIPSGARLAQLAVYLDGRGSGVGDQVARAVAYDPTSGALLGTSEEVTVLDDQPPGWVYFRFLTPSEGADLHDLSTVDLGMIFGGASNTIRLYTTDAGVAAGKSNADTYSDGPATTFGSSTPTNLTFRMNTTLVYKWARPDVDDLTISRLPFYEAQQAFSEGGAFAGSLRIATLGWHGTSIDQERGSVAVVRSGGALADLVGQRLKITSNEGLRTRSVYVYVNNESEISLDEDLSLPPGAFLRLGQLSRASLPVTVEVVP